MLGRTLCSQLLNHEVIPTDIPEVDITNATLLDTVLSEYKPDVVIHCAAMTNVDVCEFQQEQAYFINAYGTKNIACSCNRLGIRLIAISTDYVFDGHSQVPYNEFCHANGGNTIYGKSKFAGEEQVRLYCPNHIIARISWLYGSGGPSFVHTMIKLADGTRPVLKVVSDQIGNPTSTVAVAQKLLEIIEKPNLVGTFHLTCEGKASWFDFAQEIFQQLNLNQKVVPCTTEEYPRPAPRPHNSCLDKMMLRFSGLSPMPHWKDALHEFLSSEFKQ